ncbi:DUF4111 domain-containing protein [Pseudonocardiaceae bacterium YIM PH 21723]|nr:DUF4111 domain-containing protein [Pseudonocardiaceae bacterium YIM PH 21723]
MDQYCADVASVFEARLDSRLIGVYLHGSAVLGGFDPRRSDIDILVVCADPLSASTRSAVIHELGEQRLPCPARGLELSVVTRTAARNPTASPAYELHMTTHPADTKAGPDPTGHGDPDLVLHFAVCHQSGRLFGTGGVAAEVFAPVPGELVRGQLVAELRWAAEHAPAEYTVLNACRAWKYTVDGTLVSKVDGGGWAMELVPEKELIRAALRRQFGLPAAELDPEAVRGFADSMISRMA